MAAILKLRRGISTPTLAQSELFFNTTDNILLMGDGSSNLSLVKIGNNEGDVSFTGDISGSNLSLSGNANILGNITLGGQIVIGDGDLTDKIVINASLSGSLIPDTDGVYDLGATDKRYDNLYVISASIENLNVGGSGILSSSNENFTDFSSSVETRFVGIDTFTQSIDTRVITLETTFSSSVDTRLDDLESFSSSLDDIYATEDELNTATASLSSSIAITDGEQDQRLDSIETFTASLDVTYEEIASSTHTLVSGSSQVDVNTTENFTPFSSSVDTRLVEVESTSSLNEINITQLISDTSDNQDRIVELESTGSDHEERIDLLESFSSSLDNTFVTETELNSATSSLSASLTETDVDFETRINVIETTFSSSVDGRLDNLEDFSSSLDNEFLNANGDDVVSGSDQVTASLDLRYLEINGDSVISGSDQVTASLDVRYEEIASATHTLVSSSLQFTDGSGILSSSVTDFTTFSSSIDGRVGEIETTFSTSVDSRLDEIETTFSSSVDEQLDSIHSYTSSLKTSLDVSGTDLIVLGNLTVQGTQTSLNTTETYIEDKTLTIASGSTTSAEADGAGIIIDGANKSVVWNHTDQVFELNGKVSSSVGFKGDGSELENVNATSIDFADITNKPNLVSGSSQISFTGIIDKPTLFSGSSQVNADSITNFDTNVKDKMNLDSVISGSTQITNESGILSSSNENFTQFSSSVDTRVDTLETTFSSSVDSRLDFLEGDFSESVDSRLEAQETFSASLDNEFLNTNGDNVVSGSDQVTASLDSRYEEISSGTHTLVSGSSQVDVTQTQKYSTLATTGSNTFIGNQEITGSLKLSGSDVEFIGLPWPLEGETHFLLTEPYTFNGNLYEGAAIGLENTSSFGTIYENSLLLHNWNTHINPDFGSEVNVGATRAHIMAMASGSNNIANVSVNDLGDETTQTLIYGQDIQLGVFAGDTIQIGNVSSLIDIFASKIDIHSEISSSFHISASAFIGDGSQLENVVASEITYENISGIPSGIVSGSSQIDVTQTQNYGSIRQYDNSDNTIHLNSLGVVSSSLYSSTNQGILTSSINGVETTTDLGLKISNSPTFSGLTLTTLNTTGSEFTALFLSSSNEVVQQEIATAAFYHVSQSIGSEDDAVIGTAGAMKRYIDEQLLIIGAGDITKVTAGDGMSGGADSGEAILTLDTGSTHFTDGVNSVVQLGDGIVSGSDQLTSSLDNRYVENSGDENIGGTKTFTNNVIISGDLTVNGTTTTISTTNLNVEDNIIELNYGGSATQGGIYVKDATGVFTNSGSLLWDSTTDSWIAGQLGSENRILTTADNVITDTNLDSNVIDVLNQENVHSGSYLGTATTSQLDEGSNLYYTDLRVKDKLNAEGVVSGSIQITNGSGIVSSSTQISNYNTFLEINGDNVISGSSQVQIDSVSGFTSFSSSVDTRIDSLEGTTSENPLTFNDTATIDFTRVGDTITADVIGGVVSGSSQVISMLGPLNIYTSSNDTLNDTQNSRLTSLESFTGSADTNFEEKSSATHTLVSGSSQVIDILNSVNTYTSSTDIRLNSLEVETGSIATEQSEQDSRLTYLEAFTGSADTNFEEKSSATHTLVSGSSQIDVTQTTNYSSINQYSDTKVKTKLDADGVISSSIQITNNSGILSSSNEDFVTFSGSVDGRFDTLEGTTHTHTNKTNLDTINQDLSTTSNVTFNDIHINGTGSFGTDVTIYGDLTVLGTETIINTTNLAIADNMIYLNSGSTVTNPDLGFAGNYNDGTYAHAGIFRDASDSGVFKFYDGYTPEPEGDIDTTHASFNLANVSLGSLLVDSTISFGDATITTSSGTLSLTATQGINLLTAAGTDGIQIASNGNTTIFGALALQDITTSASSTTVLVNNGSNVVAQRALGSNAFSSEDYLAVNGDNVISGSSQVDYTFIQNQPTIPTNNNQLTNGAGYITSFDITTQTDDKYLRSDEADTATGIITFSNTTQSTSNTTGGVIVSGGMGIAKTLNVGEDVVAYASSDKRLKDNILPISNPLQKINSIGGYSFDWNVEKQHIYKGKDYGVIAQEIEEILPELVDTRENGYKAVKYDKLVSLLIEGIKELSQEVNELKKQINN